MPSCIVLFKGTNFLLVLLLFTHRYIHKWIYSDQTLMLTPLTVDPLWDSGVTDMGPMYVLTTPSLGLYSRSVFLEMDI